MTDIKLYGYSTSPFVRKVGCCLMYKQIPFEFVPVNPTHPKQISFTQQTQVPVLEIDGEWRNDSTPLALWLDELFPEKPLFGSNDRERALVLKLDKWVTDSLILSSFRFAHEAEMTARFRHTAWRMASIVSTQTPLSDEVRNAWPELLQMAPFIKHMMCDIDRTESVRDMLVRVSVELLEHLNGGPYFGGLSQPSLVDFAIFPQLVFNYMVGVEQNLTAAQEPTLGRWLNKMQAHLPENPILVPDFMIVNPLPPVELVSEHEQRVANA